MPNKKSDAKQILSSLAMPNAQQSDICCYSLLAMAGLTENADWSAATNDWMRIHDIIQFIGKNYSVMYAENSRVIRGAKSKIMGEPKPGRPPLQISPKRVPAGLAQKDRPKMLNNL